MSGKPKHSPPAPARPSKSAPVLRESFPFRRAYLDAVLQAPVPDSERRALLVSVARFALDGEEPDAGAFSPAGSAVWALLRLTLDTGRKRAEAGRAGGLASSGNPRPWNAKPKGGRR